MYPETKEINTIQIQDYQDDNEVEINLDSFSLEQCHKNLETNSPPTPQISSLSSEAQSIKEKPPDEFVTALEAANMQFQNYDMRPHVLDKLTNTYFLLDSGAQVSACPPDPGDVVDHSVSLKAVNNSKLKCYGYKDMEIQINRKRYPIRAIKTDVSTPILGWDFTRAHRLTTDWTEYGDMEISDKKNGIRSILKYKAIPDSQPRRLSKIDTESIKSSVQLSFEVSCMEALAAETEKKLMTWKRCQKASSNPYLKNTLNF